MSLRPLTQLNLTGKAVFLRADLNVPHDNQHITQEYKIKATLPTIDYILEHGGKIILATHLGRPQNHMLDENLSTRIIASWFKEQGYLVDHEPDLLKAQTKSRQYPQTILLLENLRFFKGEQEHNLLFAELLASLADLYVNDAFGLIHRSDTSITLLPEQFPSDKRAIGLLMEQEMKQLSKLKKSVLQPFLLVLGGSKMKDKIVLLEQFMKAPKPERVTTILIGGALAHVFLKAQGHEIGSSLLDEQALSFAQNFMAYAKEKSINLHLPTDFLVAMPDIKTPKIYDFDNIPVSGSCVDIGPQTIKKFKQEIAQAKTIFANGTMGQYENPQYAQGTKEIVIALAQTSAYTIVGGGDGVAAVFTFQVADQIDFLSTGGGATLAFLGSPHPEELFPSLNYFK